MFPSLYLTWLPEKRRSINVCRVRDSLSVVISDDSQPVGNCDINLGINYFPSASSTIYSTSKSRCCIIVNLKNANDVVTFYRKSA
ncbi:hypothetical protein J6590_094606 [Homalodisca vitripennis]|nr:hypothetical protein J6590_092340 [Homalodisca vitripennis]KAG8265444.1 hypothetical protein J6590_094606 [Homalodisca vitripennis]